ncbi:MAG: tRNA (cytidine(56)-2'-O)-methyltransferase [Hadesarchaea archaeon]|nr:tRNA (cytidine(56)-2'-O)-methyltransferase [Hadesarchaea archaeon]
MPRVVVLRMGHRPRRDKRVTTHIGLVARALGADGMILADIKDRGIEESIRRVTQLWGGPFFVRTGEPWKGVIKKWRSTGGLVIHLTMYGLPLGDLLWKVRDRDLLIVVGAEKMPGELFEAADLNLAVGHQPHSEVAALAVFLDRLFGGAELKKEFKNKKLRIIPSPKGKKVEKIG